LKTATTAGVIVIIAVAAVAVYFFASGYGAQTGTLQVGVTDSPLPSNFTAIYLKITDITFQSTSNASVTFKVNSTQFNLLSLTNVTKMLGSNKLPVGNYTMIRFNVTSATATIAGSNHTLTVPSGQVKVPLTTQKVQVKSGETTKVVLDIAPVMTRISAAYELRPVVTLRSIEGPS
jgi:hypothetical protein